ncbi:MAG: hypothetical protein WC297_03140 [Candidatus Paceibacterota bacterium]
MKKWVVPFGILVLFSGAIHLVIIFVKSLLDFNLQSWNYFGIIDLTYFFSFFLSKIGFVVSVFVVIALYLVFFRAYNYGSWKKYLR